ncbi:MAG: response regulator [Rhodospirillales bacterium]|nr:response regulator [Rhodospirillales bacterium]
MIAPSPSQRRLPARCHVLIVEDDVDQCGELAACFSRSNLGVRMAYDGASALRQAAQHLPRVVLLDFNLPDMTGLELAKQLRTILPSAAFIMMSGQIDGLSERTLQEVGIAVFVNKPVPLGPLRKAVRKLLDSPRLGRDGPRPGKKGWFSTGLGGRGR